VKTGDGEDGLIIREAELACCDECKVDVVVKANSVGTEELALPSSGEPFSVASQEGISVQDGKISKPERTCKDAVDVAIKAAGVGTVASSWFSIDTVLSIVSKEGISVMNGTKSDLEGVVKGKATTIGEVCTTAVSIATPRESTGGTTPVPTVVGRVFVAGTGVPVPGASSLAVP
jgi:hypothetical protein